jgi:hypothetical protein
MANTWGGARKGAGRKPGPATERTREIANQLAQEECSPIHVMVKAMKHYLAQNDFEHAVETAKSLAPYVHPRLSAIELTGEDGKDLIPPQITIGIARPTIPPITDDINSDTED